jgi:pleiotropic regulator 1
MPYLFSAGNDKQVKCWDLEQNKVSFTFKSDVFVVVSRRHLISYVTSMLIKVIRSYHGHLSGVYCLALLPTIDILLISGCDSVCRVRAHLCQFHTLVSH